MIYINEAEIIKTEAKTKGNLPIWGGGHGRIKYAVYKNVNKKNSTYRTISFTKYMGIKWANLPVSVSEIGHLQNCLDDIKRWLKDK